MRITDGQGPQGLWLGGWLAVWLLVVEEACRTSQSCAWFALRRSWREWVRRAVMWLWAWTVKPPSVYPHRHPSVCPCPMLYPACPQVPVHPRRRVKARRRPAASTHRWPLPGHGLVREEEGPVVVVTQEQSLPMMTARALRLHRHARLAVCTAALFSVLQRMGGADAEMPQTRPCTACASGPVCGAQRVCSTTACRTLRESSGSLVHVMTQWGATRIPSAVPAGWPSWPYLSLCPACAATCLCAPACDVGRGVAAVGESTRQSDEARLLGGRGFLDRGGLGIERREHPLGRRRLALNRNSALSRPRPLARQSPTAFRCIRLFLFSTWGLPHWSMPAVGALHSDQALWEL